jgi:hypothetical protein
MQPGENPPVGLILTLKKDEALAHYALEGLKNTVLAREYRLVLPDEKRLAQELEATRKRWERTRSPTAPVEQPPLFPLVVEEE